MGGFRTNNVYRHTFKEKFLRVTQAVPSPSSITPATESSGVFFPRCFRYSTSLLSQHIMLFHTQGALVVSGVLMAATSAVATDFKVLPRGSPLGTLQGCYSSIPGYGKSTSWTYQSSGWCLDHCAKDSDYAAFALTGGSDCVCGNTLPPASAKVSNDKCSKSCSGWPDDMCMSTRPSMALRELTC